MKIFITADHHFHHKNIQIILVIRLYFVQNSLSRQFCLKEIQSTELSIIEYCGRPFKTAEEMDTVMIEKWNNKVGKDDLVIHLGDFALGTKEKVKETRGSRENRDFY